MNVAPKYNHAKVTPLRNSSSKTVSQKLKKMPTVELPLWLKLLLFFQRSSTIFTVGLIAISAIVYAQTNHTPKQWTQEYRKLKVLQSDEKNLMATNESLKNQIAEQAEKTETGLVNQASNTVLFLSPVKVSQAQQATKSSEEQRLIKVNPQGY